MVPSPEAVVQSPEGVAQPQSGVAQSPEAVAPLPSGVAGVGSGVAGVGSGVAGVGSGVAGAQGAGGGAGTAVSARRDDDRNDWADRTSNGPGREEAPPVAAQPHVVAAPSAVRSAGPRITTTRNNHSVNSHTYHG